MAAIFLVASFSNENLTSSEAGRVLARVFAVLLALSGLFVGLVALLLLREERRRPDHYITPGIVGMLIGSLEGFLFLWPTNQFLWAPFALLVFALRPVRRLIADMLQPGRSRR